MEARYTKTVLNLVDEELHLDITDEENNTVWVKTKTGEFKITGSGTVIYFGHYHEELPGEIIHKSGERR